MTIIYTNPGALVVDFLVSTVFFAVLGDGYCAGAAFYSFVVSDYLFGLNLILT